MSKIALHEYLNEIQHLLDEELYDDAAGHCRSILRQHPRHVDTYRLLGQALLEQYEYAAADDVFQRVLRALPNDLTAHIGLSMIAQERDDLPKAIWHMQCAYELDPYTPSLQTELKKLYNARDGHAPAKLILTQGALAHLHFRGEMYQTAVSEWRMMLEKEPNRLDIRVMLAESYRRQDNRVDTVELSRHLLEEAPDCIQAIAIIAEIWLLTGRMDEAQSYLEQLQALTQISEATFEGETAVGRAFSVKGAPPLFKQIMVEHGEGAEGMTEDESEAAVSNADWLSEVEISDEDEDSGSDWFTSQAAAATSDIVAEKTEDSTNWLLDMEPENEAETDAGAILGTSDSAGLPDWLGDEGMDSSGDELDWFAEEETAVVDTPLVDDDELDWLSELTDDAELASDDLFVDVVDTPTTADAPTSDPVNDDFDDLFADTPIQTESRDSDSDDGGDLFDGLGLSGLLVGTAAAGAAAILHNEEKEEDDDSLDWLGEDFEPLTEEAGSYTAADDDEAVFGGVGLTAMLMDSQAADDGQADDGMGELTDELTDTDWFGEAESGEETAVAETDLPDWLGQEDDTETTDDAADLPDWLNQEDDAEITDAATDLPDWLAGNADEQAEATNDEALPDWLAADSTENETDPTSTDSDDLPDWLAGDLTEEDDDDDDGNALAGIVAAGAVASGIAIAMHDHDDDEAQEDREDTIMSSEDKEEAGLPEELFNDMPENEDDALDWLDQLAETQNLEAQDAIPAERNLPSFAPSPDTTDELPDWLQDSPEPTGLMDDVLGFDTSEEEPIAVNTDLPDWLQDVAPTDSVDDDSSYASQIAAGEGDIFDEMPTQVSAPDPLVGDDSSEFEALFAADDDGDDFIDLFGDEDDAASDELDALFAEGLDILPEEGDGIGMGEAALLGLAGATAVTSIDNEEAGSEPLDFLSTDTADDDFGDLFADTGETSDDDFADLFADMGDADDSLTGFGMEEDSDIFAETVDTEEIESVADEKEKFDSAGALAASALAAALAKRKKKDDIPVPPPVEYAEEEMDDTFDDMFADVDSVEDPLADLDMLKKETAVSTLSEEADDDMLDLFADEVDDSELDDLFGELDGADDPLADFDIFEGLDDDMPDFLTDDSDIIADAIVAEEGDDSGKKVLAGLAGVTAAAALATALTDEDAADSEEADDDMLDLFAGEGDESELDDLFGKLDEASDPLADLDAFEAETAVSSLSEEADDDMLDFLADGMDDSGLDDLLGELDEADDMPDFLTDDSDIIADAIAAEEGDDSDENLLAGLAGVTAAAALATVLTDEDDAIADDESDDMLDSIIAFEGQGIDDDLFAEAGMGDSISDSEISDLGEGLEWLDDSVADTGELTAFDWMDEEGGEDILAGSPLASPADAIGADVVEDQISWLDELAAQQEEELDKETDIPDAAILVGAVAAGVVAGDLLADDSEEDEVALDDAMSWLEDMSGEDSEPVEQLPSIADVVDFDPEAVDEYKTPFFSDMDDELPVDTLDALSVNDVSDSLEEVEPETAVDVDDVDDAMAWLDNLDSEPAVETAVDEPITAESAIIEEQVEPIAPADTGEVELDEELDDAMAWLDDLEDDDPAIELEEVAGVAAVAGAVALVADKLSDDDDLADQKEEEAAPPTRLSRALDWLEALAVTKGVDLTETAVDIDVSDDELTQALDGLDALTTEPAVTSDDGLWVERSDPEMEIVPEVGAVPDPEPEPKEVRLDVDGKPIPEGAVETSFGAVLWAEDDADLGFDLDLDFSDEMALMDALVDEEEAEEETAVSDPEPEPKEVRLDVDGKPIPEGAVETSFGAVLWADDDADLGFDLDLDFSDEMALMDALVDEEEAEEETAVSDPEPEPKEVRLDVDGKPIPEGAVETSFGAVLWADDDKDDIDLDLDFDIPDDPDEMAAWMEGLLDDDGGTDPKVSTPTATKSGEELQAQQTDAARSIPSPSFDIDLDDGVPVALPDDPDEAVAWLDDASAEESPDEFITFDTSPLDDILGKDDEPEDDERLFGEEMGLGHDLSDSMPEWLSFTGSSNDADWMSALPEADVSGWLEAEGGTADGAESDWATVNAPRSPRKEKPAATTSSQPQQVVYTDDLHLPETSMLSSAYNLDDEKLRNARHLVNSGDTKASLLAYHSLIQEGDGLNVIISDLEVASQKFKNEPEVSRLLGDAYTQNGQLQKALTTYRDALGMM